MTTYRQATPEELTQENKRVDDALMGQQKHLDVDHAPWVVAKTLTIAGRNRVAIFKSVALKEERSPYLPVLDFLKSHKIVLDRKGIFLDARMMFGRGELLLEASDMENEPSDEQVITALFDGIEAEEL